ncbi:MAG TPA: type IV secretion system DNA-binding domain-containing protein [Candidatus Saccharimonadales bacterium]|nr:type IV secretion system DNA-binding domain-containing protein [Candidatus Saccharimonadales bacterium]
MVTQYISFLAVLPVFLIFTSYVTLTLLIAYLLSRYFLLKKKLKAPHVVLSVKPIKQTLQSSYATEQLFIQLHSLIGQKTFWQRFLHDKTTISIELVATKEEGIRYLIHVTGYDTGVIRKKLLSYLPSVEIDEVEDYLPQTLPAVNNFFKTNKAIKLIMFRLTNHFAIPLTDQTQLKEHDPIAYLTGNMTKLAPDELISLQLIISPMDKASNRAKMNEVNNLLSQLFHNRDISKNLKKNRTLSIIAFPINLISKIIYLILGLFIEIIGYLSDIVMSNNNHLKNSRNNTELKPKKVFVPTATQQLLFGQIQNKLQQPIFETSMRLLVVGDSSHAVNERIRGFRASLATFDNTQYQAIIPRRSISILPKKLKEYILLSSLYQLGNRLLSFSNTMFLSVNELSSIYHLPYTQTTKTEDMVKSKSKELPAPHSFKKATTQFDVEVGTNTYGGEQTRVGLPISNRKEHTYIVGKTGAGKTTIIEGMALQDIQSGKGIAVIDPHGDLIEHLLTLIPKHRKKDVILVNPADKDFPLGLNILSPGTHFSDIDEEHGFITRSLMAVFMKITPDKHWGQRMEHILRNATLTALQAPTPTPETPYISLLSIQKLLTDNDYRRRITQTLTDPVLKQFWDKEYSSFGKMQQADMTSPLTNKLGGFMTDKMSRNILLQEKSTINVSKIMDQGKILLVNLSKGKLGEERSAFFGTLIISLIQLAVYVRAEIREKERRDFFVYIDEFQNFASTHFTDLFSEARKYHVYFIPSHQNIAQIEDPKLSKVVLSNSGNLIALKNGPDDEKILLPFLEPEVEKGAIINLAPHHFYMKVTNEHSEDAFSGETIPVTGQGSDKTAKEIIENSRTNYATPKSEVEKQLEKLFKAVPKNTSKKNTDSKEKEYQLSDKTKQLPKPNGTKRKLNNKPSKTEKEVEITKKSYG